MAEAWPREATFRFTWMDARWAKAAWKCTVPMAFSADETCDVGKGTGSPVSPDYDARDNEFSGEVNWVEIDIGKDSVNLDHLISPEQRRELAMATQ